MKKFNLLLVAIILASCGSSGDVYDDSSIFVPTDQEVTVMGCEELKKRVEGYNKINQDKQEALC